MVEAGLEFSSAQSGHDAIMTDAPLTASQRKLVLVVVDSMRCDMLLRAIDAGDAPTFARLVERGELVGDCVSSFPSVTPVCTSEITTGTRPDRHLIPGMNWYHRAEQRYVEYGSSFEATRAFGLFRSLYDTVYNLNMGHLNFETPTLFERLADAGYRTACTPFLIYRGRTRHEVGLEGLLKAFANAAKFHHAVWGPEELFYGELYSSRKVDAKPTLARPATRDAYSAAAGHILVAEDLYDFLLFSLPDNDYYSHRDGPYGTQESIALADDALAELAAAHGGIDEPEGERDRHRLRPRPERGRSAARPAGGAPLVTGGCCSRTRSWPPTTSSRSAPAAGRPGSGFSPATRTRPAATPSPPRSAPISSSRSRPSTSSPGWPPTARTWPMSAAPRSELRFRPDPDGR